MRPSNFKQSVRFSVVLLLIYLLQSGSYSNISEYSISIFKDINKVLMAEGVFRKLMVGFDQREQGWEKFLAGGQLVRIDAIGQE